MPDLNRIYHVQSQERRPVLNSVNVPDAAGAFLRGAIPAAGAGMPGLKARLADADARYRERVAGNRERLSAIADLVGVGKDVADAYARASDRRLAAETDALEAAYSAHMTSGADAAYAKPRTVDKGRTTGGPAVAIREHEKAFDDTDAFRNASDKAKEAFSRRRQARAAIYFAKGDSLQAAAVQNDRKRSLELKAAADENAIRNNFGTDEASRQAFEGQLNIAIFSQLAKKRMEMGLDEADETGGARLVRDATPEESAYLMGLAKDLREKYKNDRLSAWCAKVAVDDGSEADAKGRHPLSAAIEEEIKNLADEPDRVAATARLAAAERSRERNIEAMRARDNARANDLDEKVGMGSATQDEIAERASLLEKMSPEARRHHEERENHTRSFLEFARWEDANPMEAQSDEKIEDAFARRKKAKDAALALTSPEARDMALRSIDRVFGPAERAYLDDVDAALYQMSLTGFWGGEMLSAYDQREKLRECAEKGLLQRGKASQYGSMIEAQEKDPEKRAARADAIRTALARYVRPAVLDKLLTIDPNRGVVLSKTYDPSGEWAPGLRTTGYWKNRSNEVVRLVAESVVKFDRLRATGAIKADKTLDQFLEETVGKSTAYLDSRDDEIMGNVAAAMLNLDAAETAENVRRAGRAPAIPLVDIR